MKTVQLPTNELPTPIVKDVKFGNLILSAKETAYIEMEISYTDYAARISESIDYADRIKGKFEPKKSSFFVDKVMLLSLAHYVSDVAKQMKG